MAHLGFGHLWQQAEMSDVDIVLYADGKAAHLGNHVADVHRSKHTLLVQFPAHSLILSLSPYFKAQALRWSDAPGSMHTSSSKDQAKRQISITLPDASYEPAALALLAGLYIAKPWPNLLAELTPQQQVQAAVLADMWQLPGACEAAVMLLQATPHNSETVRQLKLSALLDDLLDLAALPDCLMPLFEQALLSMYGNLEAVWGREGGALQESLLKLPLHAMELLLASDKLKVTSEDTVLYTAQAYADRLPVSSPDRQLAVDSLARLVRCPHLSQFWLSASALSDDADKLLLGDLQPQMKRLLLLSLGLQAAQGTGNGLSAEKIKENVLGAPASWLLPVRDIQPVSSGKVVWELDVAAIRQAAQDSARQQRRVTLTSP